MAFQAALCGKARRLLEHASGKHLDGYPRIT